MTSGWTRWLLEQYEFPFQVVYPATLDAGDLNARFDTLLFTDGAFRSAAAGAAGAAAVVPVPDPATIPDEYRGHGWAASPTTKPCRSSRSSSRRAARW